MITPTTNPPLETEASESTPKALHGSGWCNTTYETYDAKNSGGDTVWVDIGTCPSGFTEVHCWDHRTGTGYASNPDALWARSNVCPYKGEVLFTVETDEPEDWDTGSWRRSSKHDALDGQLSVLRHPQRLPVVQDHRFPGQGRLLQLSIRRRRTLSACPHSQVLGFACAPAVSPKAVLALRAARGRGRQTGNTVHAAEGFAARDPQYRSVL